MDYVELKKQLVGIKLIYKDGEASVVVKSGAMKLARYIRQIDATLKDHEVRDYSVKYLNEVHPPELITCKKPEDYTIMYDVYTGCMTSNDDYHKNGGYGGDEVAWAIKKDLGLWSSCLLHYFPGVTCYYVARNDKCRARTIVQNGRYMRVYSVGDYDAMTAHMTNLNVRQEGDLKTPKEPFYVPALSWNGQLWGPVPRIDDWRDTCYFGFDKERGAFEYSGVKTKNTVHPMSGTEDKYRYPQWANLDFIGRKK